MTRIELAKKIVKALYAMPGDPSQDLMTVKRWSRIRKEDLERLAAKLDQVEGSIQPFKKVVVWGSQNIFAVLEEGKQIGSIPKNGYDDFKKEQIAIAAYCNQHRWRCLNKDSFPLAKNHFLY